MLRVKQYFWASLVLGLSLAFASAQGIVRQPDAAKAGAASAEKPGSDANAEAENKAPEVWIHLAGGRRMQVDDATETSDGVWYTRGNVSTFLDSAGFTRIERSKPQRPESPAAVAAGTGRWQLADSARVEDFFLSRFKRSLPLTAYGQSELHTRWRLDHRNGMDVGLHPDSVEGKALIAFLRSEEIPFLAFRTSVPGVASGPHIHVGNGSHRLPAR